MRCRRTGAEEQFRDQAAAVHATRFVAAALVESAKWDEIPIGRNVAVTAEDTVETLPEIGNDYDIGLVISGAGFDVCLPVTHLIGRAQVCVSVSAPNLEPTEFVDQEVVDHTGNRVSSVNGRGAILQNFEVINQHEGNKVDVVATKNASLRDAFSIE